MNFWIDQVFDSRTNMVHKILWTNIVSFNHDNQKDLRPRLHSVMIQISILVFKFYRKKIDINRKIKLMKWISMLNYLSINEEMLTVTSMILFLFLLPFNVNDSVSSNPTQHWKYGVDQCDLLSSNIAELSFFPQEILKIKAYTMWRVRLVWKVFFCRQSHWFKITNIRFKLQTEYFLLFDIDRLIRLNEND